MSTLLNTITHTFEVLFVFLATFVAAATIMGVFGGVGSTELRLALVESIAAAALWTRLIQRPA